MSDLTAYTCIPCSRGEHHQCRPEWECSCNHLRVMTPVPAVAPAVPASPAGPPPVAEAEAALGAPDVWGSAPDAPPSAPRPGPDAFVASGPGSPRCRLAGAADHLCLTSMGMPTRPGEMCFSERVLRLHDDHPDGVGPRRIAGLGLVAARVAVAIAPIGRAVGQ